MCADNKSLHTFLYSKCRICLKEISKFWKSQADLYNERSNEGADTDSQDKTDHGVQPTDANVMAYKKKKLGWCYHVIRGIRHGNARCPGGMLIGSGDGLHVAEVSGSADRPGFGVACE